MRLNVGTTDRILRVVGGVALILIGFLALAGTARVVASLIGVVLLATGGSGYCPIYSLCGRGTLTPRVDPSDR